MANRRDWKRIEGLPRLMEFTISRKPWTMTIPAADLPPEWHDVGGYRLSYLDDQPLPSYFWRF